MSIKAFNKNPLAFKISQFRPALFIIIFAVTGGIILLLATHAVTPETSVEAENGTTAGQAAVVNNSAASGLKYVQFGSTSSGAVRGRPAILNNTLVSDQGTLLRGGTLWFVPEDTTQYNWSISSSPWPVFTQYHLNSVRLAIEYGPGVGNSLSQTESEIATAVSRATANHMYAIIDLHWSSGEYDLPSAETFWNAIAPLYKNNTNVIFELLNEPVAWHPADYTNQNISDEETLYNIVHIAAPQTPVIMLSFAISMNDNNNSAPTMTTVTNKLTGIDWANTAVGFHGYWVTNSAGEAQLKQSYPAINTEFQTPCAQSGLPEDVCQDGDTYEERTMERLGISWLCWDCNDTPSSSNLAAMEQNAVSNGYWWPADQ